MRVDAAPSSVDGAPSGMDGTPSGMDAAAPSPDAGVMAVDASSRLDGSETGDGSLSRGDAGLGASFCDQTLGAIATAFDACCSARDRMEDKYKVYTGLIALSLRLCEFGISDSLAKSRVGIDAANAQACIACYQGLATSGGLCWPNVIRNQPHGSSVTFSTPAACSAAVVGMQGENAPCSSDYECLNGLACVGSYTTCDYPGCTTFMTHDGTCARPGATGATCGHGHPTSSMDGGTRCARAAPATMPPGRPTSSPSWWASRVRSRACPPARSIFSRCQERVSARRSIARGSPSSAAHRCR